MKRFFRRGLCFLIIISVLFAFNVAVNAAQAGGYNEIPLNSQIIDNLGSWDESDTFHITLNNPGSLYINFRHDDVENRYEGWNIEMKDENGDKIIDEYSTNQMNYYTTTVRVPAGGYSIRIYHYSGDYSDIDYKFTVCYTDESAASFEKEWNGSKSGAYSIEANKTYTGNLPYYNDVDYYKLTLANPGSLYINFKHDDMENRYEGWNIELQDEEGNKVIDEYSTNQANYFTTKVRVPAGTYYVRIYHYSGDFAGIDYRFTAYYTDESSPLFEKEWNGSKNSAYPIEANKTYTGNLPYYNDVDYYKLTIPRAASVYINFRHNDMENRYEGWNIELQDEDGNKLIDQYSTNQTNSYTNTARLQAGTYYVRIYHYSGDFAGIDYKLTVVSPELLPPIQVKLNNTSLKLNSAPVISGNAVMAHALYLSKALGATCSYDSKKGILTIKKGRTTLTYTLWSRTAKANGKAISLDSAPFLNNNSPFVDIKSVARNLGYKYSYDANARIVYLK